MNEQKAPAGIEWTRIKNSDGTVRRGFTWNPVAGCLHDCEWMMPDGQRAECYAKTIADKFTHAYKEGFAHYYWHPQRLGEPARITEPAGIFCDSMSDLFGHWVEPDHLSTVLDVMTTTSQHVYQSLTKYAPGYMKTWPNLPENIWPGVSSPPDVMFGKELSQKQKSAYLHPALNILGWLATNENMTTWMSFEPLSQDWSEIIAEYPGALRWAVIGAASNGRTYYPPEEAHVRSLIEVLDDQGVPIFLKGNMRSLPWARDNWREDFPYVQPKPD